MSEDGAAPPDVSGVAPTAICYLLRWDTTPPISSQSVLTVKVWGCEATRLSHETGNKENKGTPMGPWRNIRGLICKGMSEWSVSRGGEGVSRHMWHPRWAGRKKGHLAFENRPTIHQRLTESRDYDISPPLHSSFFVTVIGWNELESDLQWFPCCRRGERSYVAFQCQSGTTCLPHSSIVRC